MSFSCILTASCYFGSSSSSRIEILWSWACGLWFGVQGLGFFLLRAYRAWGLRHRLGFGRMRFWVLVLGLVISAMSGILSGMQIQSVFFVGAEAPLAEVKP